MAFVVCDPCVKCKFTDCVEVCPVDCFREGENMLAIDPDECIDCQACVSACPVTAIFDGADVPEKWAPYIELNATMAKRWPAIVRRKPALPEAEDFRGVEGKLDLVSRNPGG